MRPHYREKINFQDIIFRLQEYWSKQGCIILQPYDLPMGAGTFHPSTFLRAIGPEPWNATYVQASRRPTDGRYGNNPNRSQHYYQLQVTLKPPPNNIQQLYLDSLKMLGIDFLENDIRFIEDDWESPTLGAWGLGWEVWQNSMEITQFTYFQQVGGLKCQPITGEITYGLERLAMQIQDINNLFDIVWTKVNDKTITYGDIFHQNEVEMTQYNFELSDINLLLQNFDSCEHEAKRLLTANLPLAAYEMMLQATHSFNLLDARQAISSSERQRLILRIRKLAHTIAKAYYQSRQYLNFPILEKTH